MLLPVMVKPVPYNFTFMPAATVDGEIEIKAGITEEAGGVEISAGTAILNG